MLDKIKKQEPLTLEEGRQIVTHLLTTYYKFETHVPLGIDIDPYQFWFLDTDGNEWSFEGGHLHLKGLFESLREDLEYSEYDVENFELYWVQTTVKLGTYAK